MMNQLLIINGTICQLDATLTADIAVCEGIDYRNWSIKSHPTSPIIKIIDAKGKYIFPEESIPMCILSCQHPPDHPVMIS